jgi:phosphoethanolamine N-methyltransferase
MVTILELLWGEGFMAPGGEGSIAIQVGDLDLYDKKLLDIGCGLGGPVFVYAAKYGAKVVGIDLEAHLIERATRRAIELGLDKQCEFLAVEKGPLPFSNEFFDAVMSAGALTQTADKRAFFKECLRVLKPGGTLSCYDWMKTPGEHSKDMLYFFEMDGLTYAMETPERHAEILQQVGFVDIVLDERSDWYRRESRREYELLKGDLNGRLVELLGQENADHFVEDWRATVVVCEKGELRQVYFRARKPG